MAGKAAVVSSRWLYGIRVRSGRLLAKRAVEARLNENQRRAPSGFPTRQHPSRNAFALLCVSGLYSQLGTYRIDNTAQLVHVRGVENAAYHISGLTHCPVSFLSGQPMGLPVP